RRCEREGPARPIQRRPAVNGRAEITKPAEAGWAAQPASAGFVISARGLIPARRRAARRARDVLGRRRPHEQELEALGAGLDRAVDGVALDEEECSGGVRLA